MFFACRSRNERPLKPSLWEPPSRHSLSRMQAITVALLLFFLLGPLAMARDFRYRMVEMLHSCSDDSDNEGEFDSPTIDTEFRTDTVYRLKAPMTEQCRDRLREPFVWRFNLRQNVK